MACSYSDIVYKNHFKVKKSLIVISIDVCKVLDSIRRDYRIKILMEYQINEKVLDLITKVYPGDKTRLRLQTQNLTSGIRQTDRQTDRQTAGGCTYSLHNTWQINPFTTRTCFHT